MLKGALQLRINRYGEIRFAQVPERVLTKSFVVLIIGNSRSNHLGVQGTFKRLFLWHSHKEGCSCEVVCRLSSFFVRAVHAFDSTEGALKKGVVALERSVFPQDTFLGVFAYGRLFMQSNFC